MAGKVLVVDDENGAWSDCVVEEREKGDENGGGEDGGVSGDSGGSSYENRVGVERRFK